MPIYPCLSSVSKLLLHSVQTGRTQRRHAGTFAFTIINDAIFAFEPPVSQIPHPSPQLPALCYCVLPIRRCFPAWLHLLRAESCHVPALCTTTHFEYRTINTEPHTPSKPQACLGCTPRAFGTHSTSGNLGRVATAMLGTADRPKPGMCHAFCPPSSSHQHQAFPAAKQNISQLPARCWAGTAKGTQQRSAAPRRHTARDAQNDGPSVHVAAFITLHPQQHFVNPLVLRGKHPTHFSSFSQHLREGV